MVGVGRGWWLKALALRPCTSSVSRSPEKLKEAGDPPGLLSPGRCSTVWSICQKEGAFLLETLTAGVLRVKDPQSVHHGPLESGVTHTVLCLRKGGVCPGHVPGPILGFLLIASLKLVKLGFRRLSGSQESDVPV